MSRPAIAVLLAAAALLAGGCTTRSWTEETDTYRPLGPTEQRVENRGIADLWLKATGPQEEDGFQIIERLHTGPDGQVSLSLLPVALQVLAYGHEVVLEFRRMEDDALVHTSRITAENALTVLREWQVQVRLGAKTKLRPAEIKLLDRLIDDLGDEPTIEMLTEIRPAISERMEWE
ncbi:MAG: hypothetical protein IPK87_01725 [Planctomycetes bacterium]|nr:hypothetical protein [Planctomycetota bacterium]